MTSVTECCFRNTVDMQIRIVKTSAAGRIPRNFRNVSLLKMQMHATMELYTWMLGNTLVAVSTR